MSRQSLIKLWITERLQEERWVRDRAQMILDGGERGLAKGLGQGIEQGIEQGREQVATGLLVERFGGGMLHGAPEDFQP